MFLIVSPVELPGSVHCGQIVDIVVPPEWDMGNQRNFDDSFFSDRMRTIYRILEVDYHEWRDVSVEALRMGQFSKRSGGLHLDEVASAIGVSTSELIGHRSDVASPIFDCRGLSNNFYHDSDNFKFDTNIQDNFAVSSGTYDIGASGDYTTWSAAEADIDTQLTGDLTFEGLDEETTNSSTVTWDKDTNSYTLTLTYATGAEHDGTYGSGARVRNADYVGTAWLFSGDTDDVEIIGLSFDISGEYQNGMSPGGGRADSFVLKNCIFKCGTYMLTGALLVGSSTGNIQVYNNVIYDSEDYGIIIDNRYAGASYTWEFYNNTVAKCNIGIQVDDITSPTVIIKNNICQDSTTSDYAGASAGVSTSGYNVSEDATSWDTSYRSLNLHDGNSCFTDWTNNDYSLDSGGDEITTLDDGENLSSTFTDDFIENTRSDWYIGASELVSSGDADPVLSFSRLDLRSYEVEVDTPTNADPDLSFTRLDLRSYEADVTTTSNASPDLSFTRLDLRSYEADVTTTSNTSPDLSFTRLDLRSYESTVTTTSNASPDLSFTRLDLRSYESTVTTTSDASPDLSFARLDLRSYEVTVDTGNNANPDLSFTRLDLRSYESTVTTTSNADPDLSFTRLDLRSYEVTAISEADAAPGLSFTRLDLRSYESTVTVETKPDLSFTRLDLRSYEVDVTTTRSAAPDLAFTRLELRSYAVDAQTIAAKTIEAAIVQQLRNDSNVTQYVSTFNGAPAIFSDVAPQQAEKPYVVFDVQKSPSDNLSVDVFIVDIDIYDKTISNVNTRALTLAIEFSLDRAVLECENYRTVRFYRESEGHVNNRDMRISHYNMQLSARGSRYAWMQQIVR